MGEVVVLILSSVSAEAVADPIMQKLYAGTGVAPGGFPGGSAFLVGAPGGDARYAGVTVHPTLYDPEDVMSDG